MYSPGKGECKCTPLTRSISNTGWRMGIYSLIWSGPHLCLQLLVRRYRGGMKVYKQIWMVVSIQCRMVVNNLPSFLFHTEYCMHCQWVGYHLPMIEWQNMHYKYNVVILGSSLNIRNSFLTSYLCVNMYAVQRPKLNFWCGQQWLLLLVSVELAA